MNQLNELFKDRNWQAFAELFLDLYEQANDSRQLVYIRALTTKWRNNAIYAIVGPQLVKS